MIATIGLLLMLALLLVGQPVAFAMASAGALGLYLIGGPNLVLGILGTAPMSSIVHYELLTIPMFVLMAEFVIISRIADDMFDAVRMWVSRLPGGLAVAAALTGAALGAICGSSTASAATLSSTSIPAMLRHNYDARYASGAVSISGTLAMLIPPSVPMILYGLITEQSIGKLILAGVLPGVVVTASIVITLIFLAVRHPDLVPPSESVSWEARFRSLRVVGPMVTLILLVTGTIYLGVATPTEASGFGALGAMLIAIWRRRLGWHTAMEALRRAARTSCMILIIVIGAKVFGYFVTLTGVTQGIVALLRDSGVAPWLIMTMIIGLYIILGFFMDQVAILFLAVPVTYPLVMALGYDPIWFGVMVILAGEIGMVTPPVGLNVFVVAKVSGIPTKDIFIGVTPHVLVHLVVIALLGFLPIIITYLPGTM